MTPRLLSRSLLNGAAVLALAGLLLLGALWKPHEGPPAETRLPLDPSCDLRSGPCISQIPDHGAIRFSIEPRELPLLEPLRLRVHLDSAESSSVAVEITGVNMDMGYNRVKLSEREAGVYEGQAVLPVCSHRKMIWEALVQVETGGRRLAAPYQFYTLRQ